MKKLFLIFVFPFTLFAQESLTLPSAKDLKYKAAQLIDDATTKAVQKANENDELGNKSGFVLGVFTELQNFNFSQIIAGFQELSEKIPSLNGGLILGYQHFFNSYVGMRITGFANVGTQARIKAQTLTPAYPAGSVPASTTIQDVYQAYLPVEAGADIVILATAYESGKHSFGFSAGFGYKANWYVVQKADATSGTSGALENILQKPNNLVNQGVYPEFGIYYFYGSHQFEVSYRFAEFSFLGDGYNQWQMDTANGTKVDVQSKFLKNSSLILSYLYRF